MASSRKLPLSEPDQLYGRFRQLALARCQSPARVAVAYSGGLDSSVLLHLFARLRAEQAFSLQAFHVHHGLSAHADAWLAHCAQVSAQLDIPFSSVRADLSARSGAGLEADARAARYRAYADLSVDWVVLAHHQDDQAETVLYRLARGAGVQGAAGMPVQRALAVDKQIWRPLLGESRASLQCYAQQQGLSWVEDESNARQDFDRNYLRHAVMPALQARFPAAPAAIARAARHFAEAASLLDELAQEDAGEVAPLSLDLARLRPLPPARQRNLLRWFLARHALRLEERQLHLLLDQVLHARDDAMPFLRVAERSVRRYRERLWVAILPPQVQNCVLSAPGDLLPDWCGELRWQRRDGGLAEGCWPGVQVRARVGGERLKVRRGGSSRPVKDLLQEAGVPPWLRSYWPLLWRDEVLLAVAGIAVAADYQAEGGWWPIWLPQGWPLPAGLE